ncbi:MAG: amidase domain-containing protein [Clostridium luticellarii]|jgi:hypothetical protein|uniref:Putative amidase domain protein n=1 Tax=Clostridium luticellarii TaxID=1691940 RepID=A0A2T0BF44_9CLOT|nr:amidase domain-containing protein [Clostridium luticellarii]MCI1946527.1 amidase domain-containing protein [Clostridium luticellarii]MCI1996124.1 amidase domain-containing protein [Clostridium luticellarii]MCI2040968.1 amidase domain-containing protein [Clostridium luticellarii]PRR82488.1 putative amidase domain protein [Clostridium luticellarii]
MIRKKISTLVLCISLVGASLSFGPTASASPVNSNAVNAQDASLTQVDKSEISSSINEVLSLSSDVLKNGKAKDYSNIVKDPELLELLNKQSKFDVEWFKKFDGKIDNYKSNVTITRVTQTAIDTYAVDVLYDVEFKLYGAEKVSKSKGEKYRFEVKYEDGKYYITKKLDLDEDTDASVKQQSNDKESLKSEDTYFPDYDSVIDSKIKVIDDKSNNIDRYYEYFTQINSEADNSNIRLNSYSGYNAGSAVSYAERYAESPNYSQYPGSKGYFDEGKDCTDFVSQCAYAGGVPASSYWYAYSAPWINVVAFRDYMVSNGYTSESSWTDGARVGDIVQFYNPQKSEWAHSVILTGNLQGVKWFFCGHSKQRLDYPLYDAYAENGYTNMRTLEFWH